MRMRFIIITLLAAALFHIASAQTCNTGLNCFSCATFVTSASFRRWCSNELTFNPSSGCCVSAGSRTSCPSNFQWQYTVSATNGCGSREENPNFFGPNAALNAGQIVYIVIIVLAYFINIGAVVSFCRRNNIPPCGYIAIAVFFTWWVWCCLIPARRNAQLVVIQSAPHQAGQVYGQQPYVAPGQPYVAPGQYAPQPYGQPAYPQSQPGYAPQQAPNPYSQPPNPYNQPHNPYEQAPSAPPPHNTYVQAPNPYANADIVKPH